MQRRHTVCAGRVGGPRHTEQVQFVALPVAEDVTGTPEICASTRHNTTVS